jgi:hypothetical protein
MTREFGIGPVPENVDENLRDFLTQARRLLLAGNRTGAFTGQFRGSGSGLSGVTAAAVAPGAAGAGYVYDPTPPPTPTGVAVGAGIDFVSITTDPPTFSQGNGYGRTIVYGAKYGGTGPFPTYSSATIVHEFVGQVGTFPTEPATQWHIWVKWRTRDGIDSVSPQGGTNGSQVTTGQDVTQLLEALSGAITRNEIAADVWRTNTFAIAPPAGSPQPEILPFIVQTTPTTLNGATIPAGVYIDSAYIRDLTAVVARMGNAWITNAMIATLAASKITAGSIAVGEYIQSSDYVSGVSGWRIGGDMAEFGFAQIRGTLQAGQIGANYITTNMLQANSITAASGVIADLAVTTAKIADLSVDSLKIANNAVSVPIGASLTTDVPKATALEEDLLSVGTIDAGGAPIMLICTVSWESVGSSPGGNAPAWELRVGGTTVWAPSFISAPSASIFHERTRNIFIASPGTGSLAVKIVSPASALGGSLTLKAEDSTNGLSGTSIVAIGLKK